MRPADILLFGAVLLAVLFLVGGLVDVFRTRVTRERRRGRKPSRRRRKRTRLGLTELVAELAQAESLHPQHASSIRDGPPDLTSLGGLTSPLPEMLETPQPVQEPTSSVGSWAGATSMTSKVAWPARLPALEKVRPQATTEFPTREVTDANAQPGPTEQLLPDEPERTRLVAHYANGKVLKGYSYDFYPNKPHFHLLPPQPGFSFTDEAVEIRMKDLKAVFFVRNFEGDPSYNEQKEFAEGERPSGRKVEVTFRDGEVLVGSTLGYDPRRRGFFFIPADPKSNNLKVFAVRDAVINVRVL